MIFIFMNEQLSVHSHEDNHYSWEYETLYWAPMRHTTRYL